jgi:hypothetical protein
MQNRPERLLWAGKFTISAIVGKVAADSNYCGSAGGPGAGQRWANSCVSAGHTTGS